MSGYSAINPMSREQRSLESPEAFEQRSTRYGSDTAKFNRNAATVIRSLDSVSINLPSHSLLDINASDQTGWETREVSQITTPTDAQTMGFQPFGNIPTVFQRNTPQSAALQTLIFPQIIPDGPELDFAFIQVMDYNNKPANFDVIVESLEESGHDIEKHRILLDPSNLCDLGIGYLGQKNYLKARASFTQGIESNSAHLATLELRTSLHLGLASCLYYEGNYSMAIEHAKFAMQLTSPDHLSRGTAHFKIGCCYAKQNNTEMAINHFIQVPSNHDAFHTAQYNAGCLYWKRNNHSMAINHFLGVRMYYSCLRDLWIDLNLFPSGK